MAFFPSPPPSSPPRPWLPLCNRRCKIDAAFIGRLFFLLFSAATGHIPRRITRFGVPPFFPPFSRRGENHCLFRDASFPFPFLLYGLHHLRCRCVQRQHIRFFFPSSFSYGAGFLLENSTEIVSSRPVRGRTFSFFSFFFPLLLGRKQPNSTGPVRVQQLFFSLFFLFFHRKKNAAPLEPLPPPLFLLLMRKGIRVSHVLRDLFPSFFLFPSLFCLRWNMRSVMFRFDPFLLFSPPSLFLRYV